MITTYCSRQPINRKRFKVTPILIIRGEKLKSIWTLTNKITLYVVVTQDSTIVTCNVSCICFGISGKVSTYNRWRHGTFGRRKTKHRNFAVGDVVMEINTSLGRGVWNVGHVTELYPEEDRCVGAVDAQLPNAISTGLGGGWFSEIRRLSWFIECQLTCTHYLFICNCVSIICYFVSPVTPLVLQKSPILSRKTYTNNFLRFYVTTLLLGCFISAKCLKSITVIADRGALGSK